MILGPFQCNHKNKAMTIGVAGGGAEGALAPLEKLVILAGQKWELGRTEMGAWQDRNVSLAEDDL